MENGKEHGNYYSIVGLYWNNGEENGNYYSILGLYWKNGTNSSRDSVPDLATKQEVGVHKESYLKTVASLYDISLTPPPPPR